MARQQKSKAADEESSSGPRPTWRGTIKLSLVAIPVRVFPATNAASDVHFRQLHRKCHTPIQLKKWCPHCNEEVAADDIVKGYEVSKGRYSLVEQQEVAKLRPESTKVIDVSHIVDASTVDPVYIERSYVLAPDSAAAGSPFAVFREALADKAGVGRLALHGREYLVAVLPKDTALMLYTLRTKGEVRDVSHVDGLEFAQVKTKPDEVRLARQVLASLETADDLSDFTDHYQEALRAMLERKTAMETVDVEETGTPKKVVNLMDALRQSLAQVSAPKRKAAKVIAHPSTPHRKHRKAS
jgi:DNA end-binding protein Ku